MSACFSQPRRQLSEIPRSSAICATGSLSAGQAQPPVDGIQVDGDVALDFLPEPTNVPQIRCPSNRGTSSSGSMGGRPVVVLVVGSSGGRQGVGAIAALFRVLTVRNAVRARWRFIEEWSRVRSVRSVLLNRGLPIWRWRTRIWWRRARISASRESPVANNHRKRVSTRRTRPGKRITSAKRYRRARRPKPLESQRG